jgi:outer membrane receptor protein involved in Fe transport
VRTPHASQRGKRVQKREAELALLGSILIAGVVSRAALAAEADSPGLPGNSATAQELPQVMVIGNAPLLGFGLPLNQVPSNVQTADSQDMKRAQTTDVADYLNRSFSGVNASESADNPFQLDINYHGFTASALLGTPEGLSVYVDGVRVNESFGDTVNWDLIPESAISTVSLLSGSNPVFGLNTLGGALSLQTKSGHDNPGTEFEAYGGSFGRRSFQGESGGALGPFDYFATVHYFDESGWRDVSPTTVWQAFGKVGWQNDKTDVDLSYTYADTSLFGNGATPLSMLYYRRAQSYTPDFTHNLLHFVNLTGTQFLSDHLLLAANAYYRHLITGSSNGSNNDNYLNENYPGPPLDCSLPPADRLEIAYCSNAAKQLSGLIQRTAGFGVQLTDSQNFLRWKNQAILGVDYRDSDDNFAQAFRYGTFARDRSLIYLDTPLNNETVISLRGGNRIFGAYLTDTLSAGKFAHFTVSARYNRSTETLNGYHVDTDVADAGSGFDAAGPLVGGHTFSRINPAIGLTVTPTELLTYYANYNEASRAPSVVELGCANPQQPCGLPNDFASDPDLKQVVAHTVEIGLRGNLADRRLNWSADVFRTLNRDDIQFIATSTNAGYFDNVGSTRRQGLDLAVGGKVGGLQWHLAYSLVAATFQSSFVVSAGSNSTADANGDIVVHPGDRIPLIPRHTGRLVLEYEVNPHLELGGNLIIVSGSYLHGNENNANQAGGTNGAGAYISPTGTGWIPSYAVVNLQGTYHLGKSVEIFARIVNVLDEQYSTAGFLTRNTFNPNGTFRSNPGDRTNENAVSPGTPRAVWAGVRLHWD